MDFGSAGPLLGGVFFVMGAIVGSFLNVVIWRLPRGGARALVSPAFSHCPHCKRQLTAWENIPLVSFLALRARCRTCREPISPRYFVVELVTACLFVAMYLRFGPTVEAAAYCLFLAALLAALFIDLELFIIPDELNTFALLVGIGLDIWLMTHGDPRHVPAMGWLPRSILGAMVCAATFVFIQLLGLALFKKDAMGDGDVKLARAIGAMLPLQQALVSFLLAVATGAVIGLGVMVWHSAHREAQAAEPEAEECEEAEPQPSSVGTVLAYGAAYVFFVDLLLQLGRWLRVKPMVKVANAVDPPGEEFEEEFQAGPTHIPFGPFMVVGAVLAVFAADGIVNWYLAWAHLTATAR